MGKKSKLVALVAGASLLLGTFGLTACTPDNNDKTGNKVPEDIYAIYTAYAETAGDDAMTYDEWYAHLLETAKGDKGDDGKSAYDIWKENGHSGTEAEFLEWLKGGKGDDGKSAYDIWKENGHSGTEAEFLEWLKGGKGDDGKSAYDIWKENGHSGTEAEFLEWLKGDKGDDGDEGPEGKAGTKWFTGEDDEPSADLGAEGDFYLNTKTFDLWTKIKDSGWTKLGCIKGADAGSEESPQYKEVKDFGPMTINTEEVPLSLNDVENGTYFLVVESDSEATANNLTSVINKTENYDMYCPLTKGYKSVLIKGDSTTLSLKATQSLTGNVKLFEYSAPTIDAGETYEIPLIYNVYGRLHINLNSSLIGHKVNLEVKFYKQLYAIELGYFTTDGDQYKTYESGMFMADGSSEYVVNTDMNITSDMQAICIGGYMASTHCNGTITVTLAD